MKHVKKIITTLLLLFLAINTTNAASNNDYSKLTETLLNQDPDPVEPGEYVELRFKVEKSGNDLLSNIQYELIPQYPFYFDGSDEPIKKLGDWIGTSNEDEFYILYYKLKVDENALQGKYELTLKQTSQDISLEREINFDVRVDEKKSPKLIIGQVQTSPSKLIADYDEGLVKVEISNVGDEKAQQVIVNLNVPDGFEESFGYSSRVNIGTIEAGESKFAEFYLDTKEGLAKGNHKTTLNLQYKEDDTNVENDKIKNIQENFSIQIFGRPEYKVTDLQVSKLTPGKSGEIKFKIQNIGSRESDSTSVQIFKDSSQPFNFEDKSDFIGKIDVNDEGEVTFNIDVDKEAEIKEYKLKLQIRSVVDNDVLTEYETIIVNIQKETENQITQSGYLKSLLYILVLVIGFILGRVYKKKNKNPKNN